VIIVFIVVLFAFNSMWNVIHVAVEVLPVHVLVTTRVVVVVVVVVVEVEVVVIVII